MVELKLVGSLGVRVHVCPLRHGDFFAHDEEFGFFDAPGGCAGVVKSYCKHSAVMMRVVGGDDGGFGCHRLGVKQERQVSDVRFQAAGVLGLEEQVADAVRDVLQAGRDGAARVVARPGQRGQLLLFHVSGRRRSRQDGAEDVGDAISVIEAGRAGKLFSGFDGWAEDQVVEVIAAVAASLIRGADRGDFEGAGREARH